MSEMLLNRMIKQEKSLFQNSTLEQMRDNQSISDQIKDAVKKDRLNSAQRGKNQKASGSDIMTELDKIMGEIDSLNDNDKCLTTRVINLEKGLGAARSTLNVHNGDIQFLKDREMPTVTGEVDTSAIMKAIADLKQSTNQRFEQNDAEHKEIWNTLKPLKGMENLRDMIDRLRDDFNHHKNKDFKDLENRFAALEKRLNEALKRMENMGPAGPAMDEDRLRALEDRVTALENALDGLKNEFARWIKELQDQINAKPSFEKIEMYINARFDEIVKALSKQFAGKDETRKALKMHEKQLQNLYNLIMQRCGGGENEEDAMFSKKPLGGLSCASCEKGLMDMYGKKVEFMPWNKLPFRDPAERIARVGQGFSKMLSMLNPDQLSRYEAGSKMGAYQQQMNNDQNMGNGNEFYEMQDPASKTTHGNFRGGNNLPGVNRPGSVGASNKKTRGSKQ